MWTIGKCHVSLPEDSAEIVAATFAVGGSDLGTHHWLPVGCVWMREKVVGREWAWPQQRSKSLVCFYKRTPQYPWSIPQASPNHHILEGLKLLVWESGVCSRGMFGNSLDWLSLQSCAHGTFLDGNFYMEIPCVSSFKRGFLFQVSMCKTLGVEGRSKRLYYTHLRIAKGHYNMISNFLSTNQGFMGHMEVVLFSKLHRNCLDFGFDCIGTFQSN